MLATVWSRWLQVSAHPCLCRELCPQSLDCTLRVILSLRDKGALPRSTAHACAHTTRVDPDWVVHLLVWCVCLCVCACCLVCRFPRTETELGFHMASLAVVQHSCCSGGLAPSHTSARGIMQLQGGCVCCWCGCVYIYVVGGCCCVCACAVWPITLMLTA